MEKIKAVRSVLRKFPIYYYADHEYSTVHLQLQY